MKHIRPPSGPSFHTIELEADIGRVRIDFQYAPGQAPIGRSADFAGEPGSSSDVAISEATLIAAGPKQVVWLREVPRPVISVRLPRETFAGLEHTYIDDMVALASDEVEFA